VAGAASKKAPEQPLAEPPSRLRRILKKIWWLHSFFALSFGVGVMLFARAGLAHADKVMIALFVSWLLMFVAFRFIVGPTNRREGEGVGRKGVRLVTNYIIKQFYQQMFFFLVPLYASSATWSLHSFNWWLAPVLLICAVVSTMDLVFDNFIMERRLLAAAMYGLAMFGVLNVMLPLVFGLTHLSGLFVAAAATPVSVALLSFPIRTVFSSNGLIVTIVGTALLLGGVWIGREHVPPAPMAMPVAAVGHGSLGSYECLPPSKRIIASDQLDGLRCGSLLREPGGLKEDVVHVWSHGSMRIEVTPEHLTCDDDGEIFRSFFPAAKLPVDPVGTWSCSTYTQGGQLVGINQFTVKKSTKPLTSPTSPTSPTTPTSPVVPGATLDARPSDAVDQIRP
jgi:hypothetical protein